jgi:hypothetical protein
MRHSGSLESANGYIRYQAVGSANSYALTAIDLKEAHERMRNSMPFTGFRSSKAS